MFRSFLCCKAATWNGWDLECSAISSTDAGSEVGKHDKASGAACKSTLLPMCHKIVH